MLSIYECIAVRALGGVHEWVLFTLRYATVGLRDFHGCSVLKRLIVDRYNHTCMVLYTRRL